MVLLNIYDFTETNNLNRAEFEYLLLNLVNALKKTMTIKTNLDDISNIMKIFMPDNQQFITYQEILSTLSEYSGLLNFLSKFDYSPDQPSQLQMIRSI